ncbi:MAG: FAD-binding protein [Rhodobacteraceae bacterium]|nr:FAD-binding protein [Paracoccaceae bacterium]
MRPSSEDDLAEIIRTAAAPLRVCGGGTRPVARAPAGEGLSVAGLTGIVLYEPQTLTLVVRAGTPLAEVEGTLAAEGQRLPFEPPDWRGLLGVDGESTIGGVVAANASGPRRVQAGAARDSVIGVRFVDGTGLVVKSGGRTMKNVTGYDLVKLMAGSRGTLGVLTEVSLKLLPAAGAVATLVVAADDPGAAVSVMQSALSSPHDVTGAAWLPGTGVLVRVEGLAASVAYRSEKLALRLDAIGVERDPGRNVTLWQDVASVRPLQGRSGDLWRFSLRPSEAPRVAARLGADVVLDWGGGLLWTVLPAGKDARALARPYAGHATLMRADRPTPHAVFEPEPPAVAALTRGLRARFDPRAILNRGLMD